MTLLLIAADPSWTEISQAIATIVVATAVGIWTIFSVWKRGEFSPRIEFKVDVNFVGIHDDQWLVELVALVDNKGMVRHEIKSFTFTVQAMMRDDKVQQGDCSINCQTLIPHKIGGGSWLPKDWCSTFIEPGINTRYSHVASVPVDTEFVLIHGKFDYENYGSHTADKLLAVPRDNRGNESELLRE
jgi:hypothetical protein